MSRYCFDLDGVLCTIKKPYELCEPMPGAVDLLLGLKQEGHTIVIYTARGMGGSAGNLGLAVATIGKLTVSQLADWGITYDELYFGKPSADIYVDDKSLNSLSQFKEQLLWRT